MTPPRRYPFGLDADRLIDLIAACWRAHDGQWFLKVAAARSLGEATELNARALASLGRIELREFKRVAGIETLDEIEQVADWYRFNTYAFGGPEIPRRIVTVIDQDTLEVEHEQCLGVAMAEQSGYDHLRPGEYPPCRGWLERQRAWGEAFSPRYRFCVEREPRESAPCRYVVRRERRAT